MRIVQILLWLSVIVLPLGQLGRVSVTKGVALTPLDLTVLATIITWFGVHLVKKIPFPHYALIRPLGLFLTVSLLSIIIRVRDLDFSSFIISFLYFIRFLSYIGIYFVVKEQTKMLQKRLFFGLIISGFVIAIGGIVQYLLYPNLRNLYYAGWDEHLYRVFSSFLDPNFTGSYLALTLTLIASILFGKNMKQQWHKNAFLLGGLAVFVALVLTYSRGAYIMLIVSLASICISYKKIRWLFGFFAILVLAILFLPKNLQGEGVNLLRTASAQGRVESMTHALIILRDHPLLGVGFDAYRFEQRKYGFLSGANWQDLHSGAGVENSFLFVLATTGIVGFVFYLHLWYRIFKEAKEGLQVRNNWKKVLSIALLASICGLFVNALFINSLFYPSILFWLWVLIAVTESA